MLGAVRPGHGTGTPRLPKIDKPGRRPMAFAAAAVTPEKRRQRNAKTPWPWKIFSLDSENLMRVRRLTCAYPLRHLVRRHRQQQPAEPRASGHDALAKNADAVGPNAQRRHRDYSCLTYSHIQQRT